MGIFEYFIKDLYSCPQGRPRGRKWWLGGAVWHNSNHSTCHLGGWSISHVSRNKWRCQKENSPPLQYPPALPRPSVPLLIGGADGQTGQLGWCGRRQGRLHRRHQGGETTIPRLICHSIVVFLPSSRELELYSFPNNVINIF